MGPREDGHSGGVLAYVSDPSAVYRVLGQFFHALRAAGVAHVVVSPGSRSTPLAVTAKQVSGLRTWVELDERAAAFFALGLARESGQPAVLVCTSGTAAANYLPAVVEAHYSRIPLIVATADRPPEWRDWGAGQTIDQVGLYGRYPRWTVEVPIPEAGDGALRHASQLAARAVEVATGAPAGAVHLNWPLREPLAPPPGALELIRATESTSVAGPHFGHALTTPDPAEVEQLVDRVRRIERGIVLCGPAKMPPALRSALTAFANASGWPILADPTSNLRTEVVPGRAPILDCGDGILRSSKWSQTMHPEVVLRVGDPPVSKAGRLFVEGAAAAEVIWLDEGGQWGEPSHRATRVIRGGAAGLLAAAAGALVDPVTAETKRGGEAASPSRYRKREWCRRFEAANERARLRLDRSIDDPEAWSGLAVASVVARAAPANSTLFSSNSMSIRLLDLAMANRSEKMRVLCNRGASGIDGVTSTALGVAASGQEPSLLLTGDLAFLHDLSGLLLARREAIPLTIVVLDDGGGGIFSFLPIASQGEAVSYRELFQTPHELDLERVATLFELPYARVHNVAELEAALLGATAGAGVSIVHIPLDARLNESRFRVLVAEIVAAVEDELEDSDNPDNPDNPDHEGRNA